MHNIEINKARAFIYNLLYKIFNCVVIYFIINNGCFSIRNTNDTIDVFHLALLMLVGIIYPCLTFDKQ